MRTRNRRYPRRHVWRGARCATPSTTANTGQCRRVQGSPCKRTAVCIVGVLVVVSVTLAVLTLPREHDAYPSFTAFTPTAPYIALVAMPNYPAVTAVTTTPLDEVQPIASRRKVSLANGTNSPAHDSRAQVSLAIHPWGEVYVNGKKRGTSPPIRQLALKPGRHVVEVRNDAFPPYRIAIDLRSKASAKVAHDFTKSDTTATKQPGPRLASMSRSAPRFLSEEWPR
jgi:hypothetical protein